MASLSAEQSRIIHLLERQPNPDTGAALLSFSERHDRNPQVRLQAARVLVESGLEFPGDRLSQALVQIRIALPAELRAQADQLRARLVSPLP